MIYKLKQLIINNLKCPEKEKLEEEKLVEKPNQDQQKLDFNSQ